MGYAITFFSVAMVALLVVGIYAIKTTKDAYKDGYAMGREHTLSTITFTMHNSGEKVVFQDKIQPEEYEVALTETITPEWLMAQGLAEMPGAPIVLNGDDSVADFMSRDSGIRI